MPCEDCSRDLNRFNPACLECGGRYLRAIQKLRIGQDIKREWLRKVLADWMAFGHEESALRELAARR